MWPAVRAELRLPRTRVRVGRAAAVVAVAALVLMPINGLIAGHPEAQAAEEIFYDWYDNSLWQYSSGFLIGQLVALALGAALVFNGPVRSPRVLATKAVVAAGAGVLLAAVNAAVAIPVAAASAGPAPVRELQQAGWPPGTYLTNVLGDPAALLALAVLLGAFPLYALTGVGLAVLVPWRWVLVPVIPLWWAGGFVVGAPLLETYPVPAPAFWEFLLLPQVAGLASIMLTTIRAYPPPHHNLPPEYAQSGLLLGALGYAVLLNAAAWYVLARRRARTADAGGPT